jgi:hypothetical protein
MDGEFPKASSGEGEPHQDRSESWAGLHVILGDEIAATCPGPLNSSKSGRLGNLTIIPGSIPNDR